MVQAAGRPLQLGFLRERPELSGADSTVPEAGTSSTFSRTLSAISSTASLFSRKSLSAATGTPSKLPASSLKGGPARRISTSSQAMPPSPRPSSPRAARPSAVVQLPSSPRASSAARPARLSAGDSGVGITKSASSSLLSGVFSRQHQVGPRAAKSSSVL